MKALGNAVILSFVLSGCAGYVPGQQSYWDARLKEMCEKDGGVTVIETIAIPSAQAATFPRVDSYISISPRQSARLNFPVFWDESVVVLNEASPRVWRSEQLIRRRSDEKVIASVIRYIRVGGDFPSYAHPSSISCPDENDLLAQREKVFELR